MKYYKWVPAKNPNPPGYKYDQVEIEKEEYIADCLVELIKSGIHEDAHFRGDWLNLDPRSLREMIIDPESYEKVMRYAQEAILEQLQEVVEDLERE